MMIKKIACALVLLAVTRGSVIAERIDIRITGTIMPGACKAILAGGGTIDYNVIRYESLNKNKLTLLGNKQLEFSITCNGPTRVVLSGINGRPYTTTDTEESGEFGAIAPVGVSLENGAVIGLGKYTATAGSQRKIGGYSMWLSDLHADAKKVTGIHQLDNCLGNNWGASNTRILLFAHKKICSAVAKTGTLEPLPFTSLSGKINVQAYIRRATDLDLTRPIKLDGLATIELTYL